MINSRKSLKCSSLTLLPVLIQTFIGSYLMATPRTYIHHSGSTTLHIKAPPTKKFLIISPRSSWTPNVLEFTVLFPSITQISRRQFLSLYSIGGCFGITFKFHSFPIDELFFLHRVKHLWARYRSAREQYMAVAVNALLICLPLSTRSLELAEYLRDHALQISSSLECLDIRIHASGAP